MGTQPPTPQLNRSSTLTKQPRTTAAMSWQSYVDDQLLATKLVSQAAICGHDGNVWATSGGFSVTAAELKNIATNFGPNMAMTGSCWEGLSTCTSLPRTG